jgi:hypothetical protein
VQESFFKTITKRLQHLESNTSLSLQYIEEQSRFLQEVLLKMERKQITRVDSFLDTLNKTVLSELRNVRTQYDQIWQSTVLALETQREQSQREVVALTSRLNILADEVVFQKRMAILQSVLLLSCLVLVIFSRGGLAALDSASFAAFPPTSTAAAYRRYGYARSDSLSGMSMPGSSPPHPSEPNGPNGQPAGAAINNNSLAASALPRHLYPTSSSLSFKDKSLPLTPPSEYSRESTPATHHHHHHHHSLNRSPESSFYDEQQQQQLLPQGEEDEGGTPSRQNHAAASAAAAAAATATAGARRQLAATAEEAGVAKSAAGGEAAEAETSSLESNPTPPTPLPANADGTTPPPPNRDEQEAEAKAGGEGEGLRGGRENPPLSRARSAMPQLGGGGGGGLRKPLPALPEDPS